jgi:hypothetical protein
MPLDNTDVAALSTLTRLTGVQPTDQIPIARPGSAAVLQYAQVSDLGGAITVKSQGTTTTVGPASLNFTTGLTVTDDGHGNETIASYFASVKDYGAKGDGVTNDAPAFATAAAAGVSLVIPPGTYKLSANVTFTTQVTFLTGAQIAPASATTTTFNGGVVAPPTQIFVPVGSGAVAFSPATQLAVFAEWWGAVTYGTGAYPVSSPTYSDAAIQAAVNAGAASVQLMGGDYYISAAITLTASNFTLRGVGSNQNGHAGATRLIIKSATIDGLVVGAASNPGGTPTAAWLEHVTVEHLVVQRSVKPTSINGNYVTSPTGVRLRWAVTCTLNDVVSQDHSNGFYLTGDVHCFMEKCQAIRTLTNNGNGWDYWMGVLQDNSPTLSGFASGNASLYFNFDAAFNNGGTFGGGTWGHYITGGFSDTFIRGFESSFCAIGLQASGTGGIGLTSTDEDLQISGCVIDGCTTNALLISNANQASQVRISDCYLNCSAGTIVAISTFEGLATLTGNQLSAAASGVNGLVLTSTCTGVSSIGNIVTDCTVPIEFNGAGVCRSEDSINNPNIVATEGVYLTGSAFRNIVKPLINAPTAGNVAIGVKVDNGCGYNLVECSGINPGALPGSASNLKLVYNGSNITTAGAFGTTNLASGVMN